ncbi:MotA/TolQ/ExbB proton channel family protein [Halocella sp. SP3-1]|uniref:motility protein A n=1 Tax=Halocella sp. SP3-1 TaxID=2382161 RepID=UPI000F756B5B|nr:MotA/TolQ/ExbB proton channel family protein [Halocella sp. SP3-1]AZO94047.1 motility protein A [Halocella sp. SP3-1]
MDLATLIGIIFGVTLLGGAIVMDGNAIIFYNLRSILIVIGGTLAGTMISYSLGELLKIPALVRIAFQTHQLDSDEIIDLMVGFAEKARREGLLALEQDVVNINDDFLQKGIQLVVDGTDPELVRNIMETKLTFLEERHGKGRSIMATMGQLAPAFGMIGTLIGLIQMLSELDDPSKLGGGMAVALITTLYGALLANLLFIPLAGKLKERSEDEILTKEVIIEGVLSIQAGENPRIVDEKLRAFLAEDVHTGQSAEAEMDTMAVGDNA